LATAMVEAEKAMQPALFNIGIFQLYNVTHNRRSGISPYVKEWDIDSQFAIFRVDTPAGAPLATLWNFAIHGICYEEESLKQSADISGRANQIIEQRVGGVAMFVNGDAGDANPRWGEMCKGAPDFVGANIIAERAVSGRAAIVPQSTMSLRADSQVHQFGSTHMNLTLERIANCTTGGPFNICSICEVIKCAADLRLDATWVENTPRFSGVSITVGGKRTIIATVPGEALIELGGWIKSDGASLGYSQQLIFGYSNNYLGYFTSPREYIVGGYESILTMWGLNTSFLVREGAMTAMKSVS